MDLVWTSTEAKAEEEHHHDDVAFVDSTTGRPLFDVEGGSNPERELGQGKQLATGSRRLSAPPLFFFLLSRMEGSAKHETLNQEARISFACTKVIFTDKWHHDRGNSTTTGRVLFDVDVGWFSE